MARSRCLRLALAVAVVSQLAAQLAAEDVVLQSQEDVVRFAELGISQVNGSLKIQSPQVTDLRPLAHVKRVSGALSISRTSLTSLEGLGNLTFIGGSASGTTYPAFRYSLEINANERLATLAGLRKLSGALSCGLHIRANQKLRSLEGLEGITSIEPAGQNPSGPCPIIIQKNPEVTSLVGLRGLSGDLPNSLYLEGNLKLRSLEGLEGVTSIGSVGGQFKCGVSIFDAAITSLQGLSGLRGHLPGLWLWSNQKLRSLEGLEQVTSLGACHDGSSLFLQMNGGLRSLSALRNVSGPLGGRLHLFDCNSLETLEGLEGITAIRGRLHLNSLQALRSVSALHNVRQMNGTLFIGRCPALQTLSGLEGITTLPEGDGVSVWLQSNAQLRSIEGLSGLSGALPGSLAILDCASLDSLHGLEGLTSVGRNDVDFDCSRPLPRPVRDFSGPTPCSCIDIRRLPALTSVAGLGQLHGSINGSLVVVGHDVAAPEEPPQDIAGFVGRCGDDGVGVAPLV